MIKNIKQKVFIKIRKMKTISKIILPYYKKNKLWLILGSSFFSFLLLFLVILLLPLSGGKNLSFNIPDGSSTKQIAYILEKKEIFCCPTLFTVVVKILGSDKELNSGNYLVDSKVSFLGLLNRLKKGKGEIVRITIQEGLKASQIFAILKKSKLKNSGNYQMYFDQADFLRKNNLFKEAKTLEGFIFPDTYQFSIFTSEQKVLEKLIKTFHQKITKKLKKANSSLSPYELLILASIVEKETSKVDDKYKVASVFFNRLKKGYRLQTDPTVIYGIKKFNGNLTRKDLRTPSPYNSYLNYGLPPTPISNPGEVAIDSVINPPDTKYLYFVGKGDGYSHFSKTLVEHNKMVKKYQKRRNRNYKSY